MEPIDRSFRVFNIDRTKNKEVTRFVLLELEINRHMEKIDVAVTDLNSTNMFLEYDWLIKYNPEVNWGKGTIQLQDTQENVELNIRISCLYQRLKDYS